MLAPVPKKRRDSGSSFSTLGKYLTTETDKDTGEIRGRGEVMISPALLSAETAAAEMKAVAAENPRAKDAVLHFVLAWQEGEQPTKEQWQDAVKHAMDSLKDRDGNSLGDHQYMAVAHKDTDSFHVHIMANRIHPETYRANAPEWLHKTLDKSCREIEAAHGWKESNGLYKWDEEKGMAVPMSRAEREKIKEANQERDLERGTAGTGRASKLEAFGNLESLETYAKGQPSKDLNQIMKRAGVTWQEVHAVMAKHGLELHRGEKGGYTISAEGESGKRIHVAASKAFRAHFAGKGAQAERDAKLGPWEAPKAFIKDVTQTAQEYSPHREPRRNPQERAERREERAKLREDLRARYAQYKADHYARSKPGRDAARNAERERMKALNREIRERRAALQKTDVPAAVKKAMRSIAAAEAIQARERLRAELAEKRQESKPKDYRAWTTERAREGDGAAISQLRGWQYQDKRKAQEIERRHADIDKRDSARANDNDRHDPADPRRVAETKAAALRMTWTVDTKTGDVEYQVDGKRAFTDHGERVSFGSRQEADALEAGLRLAAQKYGGRIRLNGTDEFKEQAVRIAAERRIPLEFTDKTLAVKHEAWKHQVEVERQRREAPRHEAVPEPRSNTPDKDLDNGMDR